MNTSNRATHCGPGKLWSLWGLMLKKAALEFGGALHALGMVEGGLNMATVAEFREEDPALGNVRSLMSAVLSKVKRACILGDLDDVLPEIERFEKSLAISVDVQDVQSRARHLRERIQDNLQQEYYVQLRRENVPFYDQSAPFGEAVAKKFPKAESDIKLASTCLALELPMSSVVHLMRALELAISRLASKLAMPIGPKDTWGMILGNMASRINKMPENTAILKARREKWSEARTALFHLKEAWRDPSLHAKKLVTSNSEARDIYEAVRIFMQHLAKL